MFAGDFRLNNTSIYFNSSSLMNDTHCFIFLPVDDERVEANERFEFNISTTNALDTISNGQLLDITIYDDDGKSKIICILFYFNVFLYSF